MVSEENAKYFLLKAYLLTKASRYKILIHPIPPKDVIEMLLCMVDRLDDLFSDEVGLKSFFEIMFNV